MNKDKKPAGDTQKIPIDLDRLKRQRQEARKSGEEAPEEEKEIRVSQGAIEKVIDLALNASREKMPEMTVIDRLQGRLLPQLDVIDLMWQHVIEVATYRQDAGEYKIVFKKTRPIPPNIISEFTYKTAQWQKSVGGTNLKSAIDLALADIETKTGEEDIGNTDAWKD